MSDDDSKIVYTTEVLHGGRGQLWRDIIVHGERLDALSGPYGAPGPLDLVRTQERTITLDGEATDADLADRMLLESLTWDDAP